MLPPKPSSRRVLTQAPAATPPPTTTTSKCVCRALDMVSTLRGDRDERVQRRVLLAAGRAPGEMGAHAGRGGLRVLAGELGLDVAVEPLEAFVAADLMAR